MKDFDRLRSIKNAALGNLLAIPGVHAVGIGLKIVAGQRTDEPAIMVFVEKKRPVSELRPSEIIPAEIDGFKTDVYESDIPRVHVDNTSYRPLVGGSQITPGGLIPKITVLKPTGPPVVTPSTGLGGEGTLGCIAKTGEANPRIVGLTCQHVVAASPRAKPNTLQAVVVPTVITFTGVNTAGSLVVVQLGFKGSQGDRPVQVFYATTPADDPNTIATVIAERISDLGGEGFTAAASGAKVTVTGPFLKDLNCIIYGAHADNTWADVHISVAGGVISVKGRASSRCAAYVNINIGGGEPTFGIFVPIASGDGASTVATSIASAITTRGLEGVIVVEMDPPTPGDPATVSVTGVQEIECDVSSDIRVGQSSNSFCSKCSTCCGDGIGVIIDARLEVDVALIQLDPGFVDKYRAEIQDIGIVKGVHDIHLETMGYPLKTRGKETALVQHGTLLALDISGTILDQDTANIPPALPAWTLYHRFYTGAFSVQGSNFSISGDSGAAVLTDGAPNSDSEVVGILFGGSPTITLVTPIQQILAAFPALKLTIETATAPGVNKGVPSLPPGALHFQAAANFDVLPSARLATAQQEIIATPAGKRYSELVQRHLPEAQALVNNNRRVAVAWRRNGGTQIVRSALRITESGEPLPAEINGKPLHECITGIQGILTRYGSAQLSADLRKYGPPLAQLGGLTYTEALDALNYPGAS